MNSPLPDLPDLDELQRRLQELENAWEEALNQRLHEQQQTFHYHLEQGKIRFEQGMQRLQQHYKTGLWAYLRHARIRHIITAPIIYAMAIPLALLDLTLSLYQHICFRAYGIARVPRSEHIIIDRQHLAYLNVIEKLNCIYCSYGNGIISYGREIIARTEQFWCPIKHARRTPDPHRLSANFADYGDGEGFRQRLQALRQALKQADQKTPSQDTK